MNDQRLIVGVLGEPLALDTTLGLRTVFPGSVFITTVVEVDGGRFVQAAGIRIIMPAAIDAVCAAGKHDLALGYIGSRVLGIATADRD